MKLQVSNDFKTCVISPLMYYKPDQEIGKTPTYKEDFVKFGIKAQPGEKDSETLAIYLPLFRTGSS